MSRGQDNRPALHVLVVEDHDEQREQIGEILRGAGVRVDVVEDGGAAVQAVRKLKPDVVLMDLDLPIVSGFDAVCRIRNAAAAPGGAHQPYIIAVSGLADARSRRAAFDAGCNEYIVKPFDVIGALRSYVYRRQHRSPISSSSSSPLNGS